MSEVFTVFRLFPVANMLTYLNSKWRKCSKKGSQPNKKSIVKLWSESCRGDVLYCSGHLDKVKKG